MKDIQQFINEESEYHFDVLGENMKLPEDVMFYYEDGIKDKMMDNYTKTPRLYRGILQEWDNKKLIGTIKTLDFDQDNYNIPKTIKVHQLLILKHKWR
jgi:hypothetical protein